MSVFLTQRKTFTNFNTMKKIVLSSLLFLASASISGHAEDFWGDIPIIYDSYGHKITRDGSFSTGEAVSIESAWGRDNITGETFLYEACSIGDGNSTTSNHKVIGTDKVYMKAAFLYHDKDPELIQSLEKYSESFAQGITWDGSRICGYVTNPKSSSADEFDPEKQTMQYLPFVLDVDVNTGKVSDPIFLPTPDRDFFGVVPQYCTAQWISDDGATILGQVIDNSGYFTYPIVYKEDTKGNWSFTLPSEPLFNPDNLEVPSWPVPEMNAPQAQDFILDTAMKELFLRMLEDYQNNPLDNPDPFEMLNPYTAGSDALMTKEEYDNYVDAIIAYNKYLLSYQEKLDKYYDDFSRFLSKTTHFLQSSMAMNNDGSMISQTKIITRFFGNQPVEYQIPMVFDLTNGTIKELGDEYSELQITQILPDNTFIAVNPKPGPATPDLSPQRSYVCPPGSNTFILLDEYIKDSNPEVYSWMQEYLHHDIQIGYDEEQDIIEVPMTVTGLVAVSDDFRTISGGVDAWEWVSNFEDGWVTYFISDMTPPGAGVQELPIDFLSDGVIKVYNAAGINILTTNDPYDFKNLPKGIYIVNGKKIIL